MTGLWCSRDFRVLRFFSSVKSDVTRRWWAAIYAQVGYAPPINRQLAISEAIYRLIQLYTEANKPDKVKKWQAEQAKYPDAKKEQQKK